MKNAESVSKSVNNGKVLKTKLTLPVTVEVVCLGYRKWRTLRNCSKISQLWRKCIQLDDTHGLPIA